MAYQLLDGKLISEQILNELAEEVKVIKSKGGKTPHLAAILVGDDGASITYVNNKVKSCERVGFKSTLIKLPKEVSEEELILQVQKINQNPDIDGLIVQSPLPKHISEMAVTQTILPEKDVDGFHPINMGRLALGLPSYISATPNGVMEMLKRYHIDTVGKHCVVIGRSNIVGSPMSILMSRNTNPGNATVTLCHSRTENLKSIVLQADIVIVALGKAHFVGADMIKPGAVIIDVGITRVADESKKTGFRLLGDVKFDEVAPISSYITPVPGGVGLTTIASLLQNTLKAAKKEIYF
jgi:methylenetetrahydrofolate dehydrogenase (NADP+)/methenyltetrahydrofolate cyclohydrolase